MIHAFEAYAGGVASRLVDAEPDICRVLFREDRAEETVLSALAILRSTFFRIESDPNAGVTSPKKTPAIEARAAKDGVR